MALLTPAQLLLVYEHLFPTRDCTYPVLDLASGEGHNGLFLAGKGCRVVLADRSDEALERADELASRIGVPVTLWRVDLEEKGVNPLEGETYSAILVFRYLHRPLFPFIIKALMPGGVLVYETYTLEQAKIGRPRNPDHLLAPGELKQWFGDWDVIHYHEGTFMNPRRAVAGIVCRKPDRRQKTGGKPPVMPELESIPRKTWIPDE